MRVTRFLSVRRPSVSLWSLSPDSLEPSHTIALRIGIRHDMELIRGDIPVGYLPFHFFRSKIGGEGADRESKWGPVGSETYNFRETSMIMVTNTPLIYIG